LRPLKTRRSISDGSYAVGSVWIAKGCFLNQSRSGLEKAR
jgi:hypothetical protein